VVTIVTHLPPRHLDDFFAVTIARKVYPLAEIKFVHPQSPEIAVWKRDKNFILIDVGEDYNPELNNFDHHQKKNFPCSLILVATHFLSGKEKYLLLNHPAIKAIDYIDNFGFKTASAVFGIKPDEEVDRKRKTILLVDLKKHDVFSFFIDALHRTSDYDSFISYLYDCLDEAGLLDEPKHLLEEEEKRFSEAFSKAIIITFNGIRILYSRESLAPEYYRVFSSTKADILIEKNRMNPGHTSVVKNSDSPFYDKVNLDRLSLLYRKVFTHKTGFMTVLDVPVEEIDLYDVLNTLSGKEKNEK